jgi:hypothetical protein
LTALANIFVIGFPISPLNPLDGLNVAISTVIALTVIGALVNFTIGCNCSIFLCLGFYWIRDSFAVMRYPVVSEPLRQTVLIVE